MKRNDEAIDYSIPMRQSHVAILLIVYKFYKIVVRQLWPLLLIFFLKKESSSSYLDYLVYIVLGIAILSMLFAILDYYRFFFYIVDDELHVKKGVFRKKHISIPLNRVQTINFEENIIHRLFNVTSLKIDTAGSTKEEFDLDAINLDDARGIRDFVFHRKRVTQKKSSTLLEDGKELDSNFINGYNEEERLITHLNLWDLIKIGISYNHIRSAGWIIAGFFWLSSQLDELNIYPDMAEPDKLVKMAWNQSLYFILFGIVFFFVVSFIISLLRTILQYYNLSFFRKGAGFKVVSGLLTRQEHAALDNKIQLVSWKDNLLQKHLFGIFDFNLKQAGSAEIKSKKSISIPGLNASHIESIIQHHFPGLIRSDIEMFPVHIKMLKRKIIYLLAIVIPLVGLLAYFEKYGQVLIAVLFLVFFIVSFYKNYKKTKYGLGQNVLSIFGGTFGDEAALVKDYKVQALRIKQNIYQRRHDLASIKIYTASGQAIIPYIPYQTAMEIVDYLLYKVESSKKAWM